MKFSAILTLSFAALAAAGGKVPDNKATIGAQGCTMQAMACFPWMQDISDALLTQQVCHSVGSASMCAGCKSGPVHKANGCAVTKKQQAKFKKACREKKGMPYSTCAYATID